MAIRSFGNRATKRFAKGDPRHLPPLLAPKISRVLAILENLGNPSEIPPEYQVHRLSGDRKGAYSISISAANRIVFRFLDDNVYDVEVVDYNRS